MKRSRLLCVMFACIPYLITNLANASEFYTYTGNNYELIFGATPPYDTSMYVTATLEFSSLLPPNLIAAHVIPIGFYFNDGVNTITNNSNIEEQTFRFSTDASGNITYWDVRAKTALPSPSKLGDQKWEIATWNRPVEGPLDYGSTQTCVTFLPCGIFQVESGQINFNPGEWTLGPPPDLVDIDGTIKTIDGTDICAMILSSGQYMFSCNPIGIFSLEDLPREVDGTVKRQIYADGFFPKIDTLPDSTTEPVVLTHSGNCPDYNVPYEPAFVPGSAGKEIYIAGEVLLQNSETPICAMVLANGQYMFTCDGTGSYLLKAPLDSNGQFKLQVYADGFAPTIQTFDEYKTTNNVSMARATECQ
jgi:hypothetical protein